MLFQKDTKWHWKDSEFSSMFFNIFFKKIDAASFYWYVFLKNWFHPKVCIFDIATASIKANLGMWNQNDRLRFYSSHFDHRDSFFLFCFVLFFAFLTNLMFRYSEKAKTFWPIFLIFWHYLVASNYKWKMGQIFMAFS